MASDLDELDLISAIWILACNDENHLITYEGIRDRLGLDKNFDVMGLVLKRRELFRPGAPPGELDEWKDAMRNGNRLPSWLKGISTDAERLNAIDRLSANDIFRSQFRTTRGSLKSQIEIVNWGLEHIDRLRKSKTASREANAKSWQMWLVFFVGLANIVATVAIAFTKSGSS